MGELRTWQEEDEDNENGDEGDFSSATGDDDEW
jgi:hypothetical protein